MLRNITLSAEEALIEKARHRAAAQNTTLNAEFRRWLAQYSQQPTSKDNFTALMESLAYAHPGRTFSRDELNER